MSTAPEKETSPLTLSPVQIRTCVSNWQAQHGTLVWQGVGSGKTLSAIATGHLLLEQGRVRRCVIIVNRRSLVDNAKTELRKFYASDVSATLDPVRAELGLQRKAAPAVHVDRLDEAPLLRTAPPIDRTLNSPLTEEDEACLWQVHTVQSLYGLFAKQRPPSFDHARVRPRSTDAVPASRWWRHTFVQSCFRDSFLVVDEAHLLRRSLRRVAASHPAAGGVRGEEDRRSPPPPEP